MGGFFRETLLNCKTYSPTSQAGWGLNPGLGTVELEQMVFLMSGPLVWVFIASRQKYSKILK